MGDFGVSEALMVNSVLVAELEKLHNFFGGFWGVGDGNDVVEWVSNREEGFSVDSCYEEYASMRITFGPPCRFEEAKRLVMKSEVPFKIKACGRRLIAKRLPTKYLLVYRGILISFDHLKWI